MTRYLKVRQWRTSPTAIGHLVLGQARMVAPRNTGDEVRPAARRLVNLVRADSTKLEWSGEGHIFTQVAGPNQKGLGLMHWGRIEELSG